MTGRATASGFSYPLIIREIRGAGLTSDEIGRVTGVQARQVQNWVSGLSRPQGETRDRLVDVHYIVKQLEDVYTREGIEIWLHARNPELRDRRPIDLLIDGEVELVMNAVIRLRGGVS